MKLLIPSLDRAPQLDLLLSSLQENLADYNNLEITVLYQTSSGDFTKGYQKLQSECPLSVKWVKETNFEQQVKDFFRFSQYICLLTDDCIFYRPYEVSIKDTLDLITDDVLCFSWRLGLNTTTQYYVTGQQQEHLSRLGYKCFDVDNNPFIKWNWKIRPQQRNYGYCFSLDGHIYFGNEIYELFKDLPFHNPRSLESKMVRPEMREGLQRKYMVAHRYGHIFVNTINCCQKEKIPAGTIYSYPLEDLNNKYLNGYRIDLAGFDFDDSVTSGCHGELPLVWKKDG
jgi:hypothetical protein